MPKVLADLKFKGKVVETLTVCLERVSKTRESFCQTSGFEAIWAENLCQKKGPRRLRIDSMVIDGQFYSVQVLTDTCNECKQFFVAEISLRLYDDAVNFDLKRCVREPGCDWELKHVELGIPVNGAFIPVAREMSSDGVSAHYICTYRLYTEAFTRICEYQGELLLCRQPDGQPFKIEGFKFEECPYLILSKAKLDYSTSPDKQYEVFDNAVPS